MTEDAVNLPPAQAAPGAGFIVKTNPWHIDLALRPKNDSRLTGDHVDTLSCNLASSTFAPSTPSLLSHHDDSEISDWDENLETPPRFEFTDQDLDLSDGESCKDAAEDYDFMSLQFDGAGDGLRDYSLPRNPCLTKAVPAHADLVAQRRLRRIELSTGVLDFACLDVPLPEKVVSPLSSPSPVSCYLIRRSTDGFFSASAMLGAAFPRARPMAKYAEMRALRCYSTTRPGVDDVDCWLHPSTALSLAESYRLLPYIRALLDPADIPTAIAASADGGSSQISAPPRYSPNIISDTAPASPALVDTRALPCPGHGCPIASDGQPILRLFDPQMSSKHKDVPDYLLVSYNPMNRLRYLQSVNPATSVLEPDLTSLVITIESVLYEKGGKKQAGAIVFMHETSHCSQLFYVDQSRPQTKSQALLEALFQAMLMIKHLAAADRSLREVRIMSASGDLCRLFGLAAGRMEGQDAAAAEEWLAQTDRTLWKDIDDHWTDITEGRAGPLVDVRLWHVEAEDVLPANEMAIAEMYRADGRDWFVENGGNEEDPLKVDKLDEDDNTNATNIPTALENAVRPHIERTTFVPPQPVVDQGHEAIAMWSAETRAKHKQAMLYLGVVGKDIEDITNPAETSAGRKLPSERYWDDIARAMVLARAHQEAAAYLGLFMAEHPTVSHAGLFEGSQRGNAMDVDAAGEDLVQAVVEMVTADEEAEQAVDQMECE